MTAIPTTIDAWQGDATGPEIWDLAPDEVLMWEGQPDSGLFVTLAQGARFLRAVVAIGLFFYILNRLWLTIPPLWDVRMIVLAIFLQAVPTEVVLSAMRRRRTLYALTNHRMLIATCLPLTGRQVLSVPILSGAVFEVTQRGEFATILTASPRKHWWDLRTVPRQLGFERITDGARVMGLIRNAQTRA